MVFLADLVLLRGLRWQVGIGSEPIGPVKALPGASLAWLVGAGAVGGGLRWSFAPIEWRNTITVAKANIMTIVMTNI